MKIITLAAILALLPACTNHAFRVHYPPGKPAAVDPPESGELPVKDCDENQQSGAGKFRLAFIEFDDQGEMFERRQLINALQMIADAKGEAARIGTPANPASVGGSKWYCPANSRDGRV